MRPLLTLAAPIGAVLVAWSCAVAQTPELILRDHDFARDRPLQPESGSGCRSAYADGLFILELAPEQVYCARWFAADTTQTAEDSLPITRYETRVVFLSDRGPAAGILFQHSDSSALMLVATPGGALVLLRQSRGRPPVPIHQWERSKLVRRGAGMANDLAVEVDGQEVSVFVNGHAMGPTTVSSSDHGAAGLVALGLEDADYRVGFARFRATKAPKE